MNQLSSMALSLWAKKRTDDGLALWLPLVTHLTDTALVSERLYHLWLSDGQRKFLTTKVDESTMVKLVKFLGYSHDIGKATPAFQLKKSYQHDTIIDATLIEKLIQAGFTQLDQTCLPNAKLSPHAKAGEAILEGFGVPVSIGAIVGGHHGRPLSMTPFGEMDNYPDNYVQDQQNPVLQSHWRGVQEELFQLALKNSGFSHVSDIPSVTKPQAVILEGLLIMSDWIASSETLNGDPNNPMFTLIPTEKSWADIDEVSRFHSAWKTWQITQDWIPEKVVLDSDPYMKRWSFNARPVQQVVTKELAATADPGIVIVEAPMGMGKTELALVATEQLADKKGRSGLYFALPTQATANAMFDRVLAWMRHVPGLHDISASVELMHGKARFNPSFQQLPRASNVDEPGAIVVNSWFSGKKTILDGFEVGTIDHVLLLALKQRHLALRHLGLSKKVVVIDEVHAFDAYVNSYLYQALEWLGAYQVPVVLLSATLPKAKRNQLLEAYYHGKFGRQLIKDGDFSQVSADWQSNESYPLVSILDGRKLRQLSQFPDHSNQTSMTVSIKRLGTDDEELIQHVLSAISGGGIAGVIVNTVKRAQELAKLMTDKCPTMVLHSAFLASDRTTKERLIQKAVGKGATRPDRLVVIGTQVLEQSLDIDFDVLFTDIAPMDLLLQRAGRLHRHDIDRPATLIQPTMYVMAATTPGVYGNDNQAIYELFLLMRTDAALPSSIRLPADISPLVQQVYTDNEALSTARVREAKRIFDVHLARATNNAKDYQIGLPTFKPSKDLHGWLDRGQPDVDHDDILASAAVRDIVETLEVILVCYTKAGISLLDGRLLTDVSEQEIAEQVIRLPHRVTTDINKTITTLEIHTAQRFPEWQQSPWLHGALALVLDEHGNAELNNWKLHYSAKYGLSYQSKEEGHD